MLKSCIKIVFCKCSTVSNIYHIINIKFIGSSSYFFYEVCIPCFITGAAIQNFSGNNSFVISAGNSKHNLFQIRPFVFAMTMGYFNAIIIWWWRSVLSIDIFACGISMNTFNFHIKSFNSFESYVWERFFRIYLIEII